MEKHLGIEQTGPPLHIQQRKPSSLIVIIIIIIIIILKVGRKENKIKCYLNNRQ